MHVLITGGTGLIGSALTRRLLEEKHTVTILSRSPQEHSLPEGVKGVRWDGKTTAGWGGLINDVDAIVNLAGVNLGGGLWTRKRKEALLNSRVFAGQAVTEAVAQAEHKPKVLVQASAVGYYPTSGDAVLDESSPAGTDFQGSLCQQWEKSTRAVEEMGVRRVVIRSGVVLARGSLILYMFMLPFRMMVGGPVGSGRQYISWLHIDDEVEGILYLIENESSSGAYNLMSPKPVTNAEMGRTIGRVIKRPYWFPVPGFAMRLVLGELSTVVLDSWRAVPTRLQEADFVFKYPEIEPALHDLV